MATESVDLNPKFIEEVEGFEIIYCLVSGGYHSTAAALLLKDCNFKNVILVHNKTFLEMKSSIKTMEKIVELTGYEYIETIPDLKGENVWDIMRRSFQRIPEVREDIKNKKYDRRKFECCDKLKKNSGDSFFKDVRTEKMWARGSQFSFNFAVIDSSCPYESDRRRYYATELRKKNTYLRYLVKRKFVKAYPFRDHYSEKPFLPYLRSKGFTEIKHSGCAICPILIVFKIYKADRYYQSSKAAVRAGLPCFQKTMEDYVK